MKKTIVISIGDFNGIGPEVILKAIGPVLNNDTQYIVLGHDSILSYYADLLELNVKINPITSPSQAKSELLNVINVTKEEPILAPGNLTKEAGDLSMKAIQQGIELCLERSADALVTAPISKEAIQLAGYNYPGHTEFLAEKTGCSDYMMILVSGDIRVGLVTGHIPVSKISEYLTAESISEKIRTMNHSLKTDFGITFPRIAVFGLNPHAGDGGVLGSEEETIIRPAIDVMKSEGILAEGPFPADGFFGNKKQESYDGIVAMYHDQGLVPFKALSFGGGVNFTAGLPIIRTSPDHGTAYGIAGKGLAEPGSFTEAISLAEKLISVKVKRGEM